MSSTQEGTTLILASVAVCLLIYVMNQEYRRDSGGPTIVARLGSVRDKVQDAFTRSTRRVSVKKALGKRRARKDKDIDCSNVSPSDPNWTRCSQGAGVGRIRSQTPGRVVSNPTLEFANESLQNQGLGARLQDEFVNDQFDGGLGQSLGGSKINPAGLSNNAFFSEGTENPTRAVTSGLSSLGAEAFPFARKSDASAETSDFRPASNGNVPGTESVGMGMNFKDFARGNKNGAGKNNQGPSRQQVAPKLGANGDEGEANFNPFVGAPMGKREINHKTLGAGLDLSEAFTQKTLGSGLKLSEAFGNSSLGAAVAPASLGVSAEEITAATTELRGINVVQSTIGGQLDFGIRP